MFCLSKEHLFYAVLGLLLIITSAQAAANSFPPVTAVFVPELSDEFNGNTIDSDLWRTINPHWPGHKHERVDKEAVSIKNNMALLPLRETDIDKKIYASAMIESNRLQQYGYFEIRARAAPSRSNQAFWFYAWTPIGTREIDVFEIAPKHAPQELHTNLHVYNGDPSLENEHNRLSFPFDWVNSAFNPTDWNVYGLLWTPDLLRWYVNGAIIRETRNVHFHLPMRLILGNGIQGQWRGFPEKSELPSIFAVDYVRTWQLPGLSKIIEAP